MRDGPFASRPAGIELESLGPLIGGPCELERLVRQAGLTLDDTRFGSRGAGTEGAAPTCLTILGAKTPLDEEMPSMVKALLLPDRDVALRTLHLLVVPIDGELVTTVGAFDFSLPARIWAGRPKQGDALLIATADEQLSASRGGIDEVLTRRQAFLQQPCVDDLRTLGFRHGGRGRMGMRHHMDGLVIARFTAMGYVSYPLGVPFVAVARLGIVG